MREVSGRRWRRDRWDSASVHRAEHPFQTALESFDVDSCKCLQFSLEGGTPWRASYSQAARAMHYDRGPS